MIRILLYTSAYRPLVGGSEIAIEQIARRIPSFEFHIVTPRYDAQLATQEHNGNITIHRVGFGSSIDKWIFPLTGFFVGIRLMRQTDYAVLHAYQASYGAGAACLLTWAYPKTPFLISIQEGKDLSRQSSFIRLFRNIIIRVADAATAISSYLVGYIRSIRKDIPITCIPNGVDMHVFGKHFTQEEREVIKTRLGISPTDRVIISISRLVEKNGLHNLISAVAGIPHGVLLLVGSGPLHAVLSEHACQNHVYVIFTGSVPYQQLSDYLAVADVFVRSSLSEGLGSAFLEAMAAGIPVIGSSVGGIPDFLYDNETGLFCDPRNIDDIRAKILTILSDDQQKVRLIQSARVLIQKRYTWETVAAHMQSVYNALAHKNKL